MAEAENGIVVCTAPCVKIVISPDPDSGGPPGPPGLPGPPGDTTAADAAAAAAQASAAAAAADAAAALVAANAAAADAAAALASINVRSEDAVAALKAVSTAVYRTVELRSGFAARQGQGGLFDLWFGDFSNQITLDPLGGMYVKPDDRLATEACWIRRCEGKKQLTWWNVGPAQSAANNLINGQAAINTVCAIFPTWERELQIPEGTTRIAAPVIASDTWVFPGSTSLPGQSQLGQGMTFVGDNFRNCQLLFEDTRPGWANILVEAQEAKFFNIGVIGFDGAWSPYTSGRTGIRYRRGVTRTTDTDGVVRGCRIQNAQYGIDHTGRGLIAENNIFSQVAIGIDLRWPNEGQYLPNWINIPNVNVTLTGGVVTGASLGVPYTPTFSVPPLIYVRSSDGNGAGATLTPIMSGGTSGTITGFNVGAGGAGYTAPPIVSRIDPVQSREGGWRGIAIRDNKAQNLTIAMVNNTGANRALLHSLIFKSSQLDIGDIAFRGHLGTGFDVDGIEVGETATEGLSLCGGFSGTVRGVHIYGMGSGEDRNPDTLVRFEPTLDGVTDGIFRNVVFSDWTLLNSQLTGVIASAGTQFVGCTFSNIHGDAIGFDTPTAVPFFRFNGTGSTIVFENLEMIGSADRTAFVRCDSNTNEIRQRGTKRTGNHQTPFHLGAALHSVDQRQVVTPAITGAVNITAPSVSALNYYHVADEVVTMGGRVTATFTAANLNSVVELTMPTPELFTAVEDAWGSFVCAEDGPNLAGSVQAINGTNRVRLRVYSDTRIAAPLVFSLRIEYRRRRA